MSMQERIKKYRESHPIAHAILTATGIVAGVVVIGLIDSQKRLNDIQVKSLALDIEERKLWQMHNERVRVAEEAYWEKQAANDDTTKKTVRKAS